MNGSNTSKCTGNYEQALNLDSGILQLLLERNRLQHFRSPYFRRLEMLLRSIHKYNILHDEGLGRTIAFIKNEHERVASLLERYRGIHKRRGKGGKAGNGDVVEEEQWSIATAKTDGVDRNLNANANKDLQSPFLRHLRNLHLHLTEYIPEIVSRILHAAGALYTELSRGYFAPLCTVALGCISRIRVLLLRLGRDGTLQLQRTLQWLKSDFRALVARGGELEETTKLNRHEVEYFLSNCCKMEDYNWESMMNSFMEIDNDRHTSVMAMRRMEMILSRGGNNNGNASSCQNMPANSSSEAHDIDTSTDIFDNGDASDNNGENEMKQLAQSSFSSPGGQDEIGELVDSSDVIKNEEQQISSKDDKKDDGDRNLEMISILKGKTKTPKRKRERGGITDQQVEKGSSQSKKTTKMKYDSSAQAASNRGEGDVNATRNTNENTERTKEKKTKKKKVKKKKKRSKDVIDDIFGDL